MAVVTVVVAPVVVAAVEVQEVGEAAVTAIQRTRPIVAAGTLIEDSRTAAVARSGQEDAVAVGAGYAVTLYAVKGGPSPSAAVF